MKMEKQWIDGGSVLIGGSDQIGGSDEIGGTDQIGGSGLGSQEINGDPGSAGITGETDF